MAFQIPQLMPHQQMARDFIVSRPHCGVFLGIGGAKTLSTLAALAQVRPAGHILVVAPLAIARSTWIDEIEKWGFPLRTKSLLVDENDRPLSKEARLAAFDTVFTDPPTMYFINQELLSQPARPEHLVVPTGPPPSPLEPRHLSVLDALVASGPIPQAELVEAVRTTVGPQGPKGTLLPKSEVMRRIKELKDAGTIAIRPVDCRSCGGKGCRECRAGLVDRMPVVKVPNGTTPAGRPSYRNAVQWPFPTVIIDESQNMKNPSSERFKALKRVRPAIERLIELTGTPSPQSMLDLWAQIYLIDQGATLGTYTQYRSRFFTPTMHVDGRPVKWEMLPGAEKEIYQLVAPFVMSAQNASIPMPQFSIDTVNVTLPRDVMDAYKEFVKERVLELASPHPNDPSRLVITADNAGILHGKLVQFASGTIYTDDSGGYAVIHQEKEEMLRHLVGNASSNTLVAYRFISEIDRITQALAKDGIDVAKFDGSRAMVKAWNDKSIPVMLLHPRSAGPGLNLQAGGHTLVWYTLPDSLEHYQQLNGRLIRIGQGQHVQVMQMVTKGTKDATLPWALERKKRIQDGLLDAVRRDDSAYYQDVEDVLGDLGISPL